MVSSGARAAQALTEAARATSTSGVGVSELVQAASSYASDPVWANDFITTLGAGRIAALPLAEAVPNGQQLANLLGWTLATASTIWDEETCNSMATTLAGSVTDKGHWGRITALNAILTAPTTATDFGAETADTGSAEEADGVSTADAGGGFAQGFLTALADALAGIDPSMISRYRGYANTSYPDLTSFGRQAIGSTLTGYSFDPLAGALEAIAADPRTALDYLTETPASTNQPRFQQLSQRQWDQAGLAAYTTAIAAATSQRTSTDASTRHQADQLTGQAIDYLATNTTEDQYTTTTETAIASLLANSPAETTCAWNQTSPYKSWNTPTCDQDNNWFGHPLTDHEPIDSAPITTLAWRIIDTPGSTSTIATALAEHAHTQAQTNLTNTGTDADRRVNAINTPYLQANYAIGYLAGLTNNKNNTNTYEHALTTNGAIDTIQVSAMAIQDAANAGLLDPEDYTITGDSSKTYTWIITKPDGTHTIDLTQADDPTMAPSELGAWVEMVESGPGDYVFEDITNDFGNSYLHGYRSGSAYDG
ncbi:DUF6571 family protein [Actinomyces sp. MRS3W]|uniref:DUF6571 family protein n=1 Tax=Actinomyces sp. MRS3W TaxID=2800796 RepID=UPI0028FD0311|nr:DUF6571 family protein [Actinomyces sp. MRS3W]MDU0349697.1 DUF6571 family protein [Actinomyces sp. MRS3W]